MGTSDRKPWLSATVLNQAYLNQCHDSLTNDLQLTVDIETPTGYIRASDRNKYVGGIFYEALLNFPPIYRTIGEWLSTVLEFSDLKLELSNVDERFNDLLPGGNNYGGWVGRTVQVKLGVRNVESTYSVIFDGQITEQAGFGRTTETIVIIARDKFDTTNKNFPTTVLTESTFPNISDAVKNTVSPLIYGDWTVNVEPNSASVPTIIVNGADPDVNGDSSNTNNLQLVISENDLTFFDTTQVYLVRGDQNILMDSGDITNVGVGNRTFEIIQNNNTVVDPDTGDKFLFETADDFYVKVKGKDLGSYDDNAIEQARDILENYGGLSPSDFHSSWDYFRDKNSPAVSAIANIKSRIWIQEPEPSLTYVLSLLEQVRLEVFVNRDLEFEISALQFDEFDDNPSFTLKNWDIEYKSLKINLDERNNFNRTKGIFNFLPNRGEELNTTGFFRNQDAIDISNGKIIEKGLVFPNLYVLSDVENQTKEILKMSSSQIETISFSATWRSMLLDISEFVSMDINIESINLDNVPCLIRSIGYNPIGLKIELKLWSMLTLPFGSYAGTPNAIGGENANITEE